MERGSVITESVYDSVRYKVFEIAGKQSYDVISNKMKVAKEKAKTEEQQNAYEDIISELMRDNRELENIAGEYKRSNYK